MAKLYLKFEQNLLNEVELNDGSSVTIGRMPDNNIHIDNLAVSGHHARIVWENDHFVIEDDNSLNGTFVNNQRVTRCALKDGDVVLVGNHTLTYVDETQRAKVESANVESTPAAVPSVDSTVLETSKPVERTGADKESGASIARDHVGQLHVIHGKTDQPSYMLDDKLTVIGKSEMASIKLKGWFAPKVAAVINKREDKYVIAASDKDIKLKVNNSEVSGQKELNDGDLIEVAHVKMTFTYTE